MRTVSGVFEDGGYMRIVSPSMVREKRTEIDVPLVRALGDVILVRVCVYGERWGVCFASKVASSM